MTMPQNGVGVSAGSTGGEEASTEAEEVVDVSEGVLRVIEEVPAITSVEGFPVSVGEGLKLDFEAGKGISRVGEDLQMLDYTCVK
jgi:hypothetical protein